MDQHCPEHSGYCVRMDTVEKDVATMKTRADAQDVRIGTIETERKVERASLSRTDRLLVILIPALVSLAGILWTHFAAVGAALGH